MSEREPCPSDLSDAQWALIEPTLTAWRKARLERRPTGQPAKVELRDVFDALLQINRTGIRRRRRHALQGSPPFSAAAAAGCRVTRHPVSGAGRTELRMFAPTHLETA